MNAPVAMNMLHGKELKLEDRRLIDKHGRSRVGNYMHTSGGHKYWPYDPRADEIHIETVAHHLACQGRYNGATQHRRFKSRIFFSVAEHSRYVAEYTVKTLKRPDLELEAYLHDGPEFAISDMIRPMKYSPEFRAPYLDLERRNEKPIVERFNLVYPFPAEIKMADEAVTAAECRQIIVYDPQDEWHSGLLHEDAAVANVEIQMLDPYPAKMFFLEGFYEAIARREKYRPLPAGFRV